MAIRYNLEWLDSGKPRQDLEAGCYRIGRGEDCDLRFDAAGLSREHCELRVCQDRGLVLRDLGSTNGTRVEGQRVSEYACLGDLDLQLGSVRLRLRERSAGLGTLVFDGAAGSAAQPSTPDTTEEPAQAPATALLTLEHALREALQLRIDALRQQDPAALQAVLADWAEALPCPRLLLRDDARATVLALHGVLTAGAESGAPSTPGAIAAGETSGLVCHVRQQHCSLHADPLPALAAQALAQIGRELLTWAVPAPIESAPAAPSDRPVGPGLPSRNAAMHALLRKLGRAARSPISVLLLGETGVGKELLAHWLHQQSDRAAAPFLAINCAALPRDLLEAELFGIERGAATGVEARAGLFERAHGGSLFLDEVGDMPAELQVRLLRVLEDGELLRIGGRRSLSTDVRVIAATHRDLQAEVAAGRFRLDLYHRLAGFSARVPALRERPEDIAPLAAHFFRDALRDSGRCSPGMTAAALLTLQRWHWPGNVRELRQAIGHALVELDDGEALDRVHLPPALHQTASDARELTLGAQVARAEREAVLTALAISGGNHERAFALLDIGKTTFYKKLKEHGLRNPEGEA